MSKLTLRTFWILALFATGVIAGCSGNASAPLNPTVVSTTPTKSATGVPLAQMVTATFNEAMNQSTISTGTFTVTSPGGIAVPGAVTSAGTTSSFIPTLPLILGTVCTATITTGVQNIAGRAMLANDTWTFTTGTIPTVASTNPASGATVVPLNQKIAVTFNQAMNPATLTAAGTFTVAIASGGAAVAGTVTYVAAANTAIFKPTANLVASTNYTASITVAAQSASGNALAAYAWSFKTGTNVNSTPPTVVSTLPASAAITVPTNTVVTATFSKAMDPTGVTTTATFTLAVAGVGGASVPGTLTYDVNSDIATFTPSANLTATTSYTTTITNAATDVSGNPLAAGNIPNPWTFMTGSTTQLLAPNLGTAATFGVFGGGVGMTNQGIHTVINGDIGTTGASTLVTGFHDAGTGCTYTETGSDVGLVNGNIDTAPPPPTGGCLEEGTATTFSIATQAASDANQAYLALDPASLPGGTDPGAGQLANSTLPPGVYKAAGGTFLMTGGDLTLDAQCDTNAVWVFQTASSLTVGDAGVPRNVVLINGAQAKNVFWQVGSAATINPAGGRTMVGTIIASMGVTFSTPGNAAVCTLNGRALALNASVTMVNTVINVPAQ